MQAFMGPRLVKINSARDKANAMPTQSEEGPAGEKKIAKRFLAILLSCLSAWSV